MDRQDGTQDFKEKLHERGLKATHSRMQVLELLCLHGGHRSADEITEMLTEAGRPLPRGSVFKVVGDLAQHGLLMVSDAGPGRTLYEYSDHWHHHFVCRVCGGIQDVPCLEGSKPCLHPELDFPGVVEEAQIIFRGLCGACLPDS